MYFKDKRLMTLYIPAKVVGQIQCIVDHFATEVSWYGDITIAEDGRSITIQNAYLFPQVVTAGTFRTDTPQVSELYDAWYEEKLNEVADHFDATGESKAIMQYNGHSHVRAGVTASSEDLRFRRSREGINVYSIHNKQGNANWEIWLDNVVYENEDIEIIYLDEVFTKSEEYVLKPVATTYGYSGYRYSGGTYSKPASNVSQYSKPATEKKITNEKESKTKEEADEDIEPVITTQGLSIEERIELEDSLWEEACRNAGMPYGFADDYEPYRIPLS